MIGKELIDAQPVPLIKVKRILDKRAKEGELSYEQKIVYEYVKENAKGSEKKIKEALEKLTQMGIPTELAVRIVDVKPANKDEVKLLFEKVRFDLKESTIKQILDIVAALG